jgi:hypothetical protein
MMDTATSRSDRDVVIVFDHIPKCAGTSIDTILQQASCCSYGVHSASSQLQVARRLNATRHPGVTLLMGHYGFGIHALLSKDYDVRYFTFLRDPFAIARSLYTYNKATQMYLYGSFADFVVEYPFRHMVDFLGGSCRQAIERLERYCYVGFVETFQNSIRELSARIGIRLDPGVRVNRSEPQADAQGDFAALREGLTGPDFELYACFRDHSRPEHQAQACYRLDTFYQTDTVTTTLRETRQPDRLWEIVQGLDAMSGSQAFMCSKLRLDISDTAFRSLFERYQDYANFMVNTNQVDTPARFQTVREILAALLPYTPQAPKDSQIVLQAQALLLFLAQTPQAQAEGLTEDLFRQALALNPATALVCYGYAIWLRSQGRTREALALLETIPPDKRFLDLYFPEYVTTINLVGQADRQTLKHSLENDPTCQVLRREALWRLRCLGRTGHRRLADLAGRTVLIVRSGPEIVLRDLLDSLDPLGVNCTLLLQEGLREHPRYAGYDRLFVPDGMFDPLAAFPDRAKLLSGSYDALVYLYSTFGSLNSLANFEAFFRGARVGASFGYPLLGLLLPAGDKYLVPLRADA